jgi:hypothetical protein
VTVCQSGQVQVAILGPLEVADGDTAIEVAGTRLRRLLVRLAVDGPHPVSAAGLAEAVWIEEDEPADRVNALQALVSGFVAFWETRSGFGRRRRATASTSPAVTWTRTRSSRACGPPRPFGAAVTWRQRPEP